MVSHVFLRLLLLCSTVVCVSGCRSDEPEGQAWVGKTFLLDAPAISNARWKKSAAIAPAIVNYAPQFLFSVTAGPHDGLAVTIATAQDGAQDACAATVQAATRRADYPISAGEIPATSP